MNNYNIPIAKLGKRVLVIKEFDLPKIGTSQAMEVFVEQWDLATGLLEGEYKLEQLLKFNPWEDVTEINEINKIKADLRKFKECEENLEPKKIH